MSTNPKESNSVSLSKAIKKYVRRPKPAYLPVRIEHRRPLPYSWIKGKMEALTDDEHFPVSLIKYKHLKYEDMGNPKYVKIIKENILRLRKYMLLSGPPETFSGAKFFEVIDLLEIYTNVKHGGEQVVHFLRGETLHLTTSKVAVISPSLDPRVSVRKNVLTQINFKKVNGLYEIVSSRGETIGHCSHDLGEINLSDPSVEWPKALSANHNEITSENTSNSASLSLHQTSTLAFCLSLNKDFSIEEIKHGHKFDSVIKFADNCEILLDTTTSNTAHKVQKCLKFINSSDQPIMSINKYMIPFASDDETVAMINLSYATDICDTAYIQKKVECQMTKLNRNEGTKAKLTTTYSRDIAEHMKNKEAVRKLGSLAREVLTERVQLATSQSMNIDQKLAEIKEDVLDISEDLREVWSNHFLKDNYQMAHRASKLEFYEMSVSEASIPGSYISVGDKIITTKNMNSTNDECTVKEMLRNMYWECHRRGLIAPHELHNEIKDLRDETDYFMSIVNSDASPDYKEYLMKSVGKRVISTLDDGSFMPKIREYNYDDYTVRKLHRQKAVDVSNRVHGIELDPLDLKPIVNSGISGLKKLIQTSKYYQELRIKQKISHVAMNLKSDQCVVLRAELDGLSITLHSRGMIKTTDAGVLFVSYCQDGKLVRFEKWRQPDIARYLVAKNQFVSCVVSASKHCPENKRELLTDLYGSIIYENSWGLSKVLKPFRYLITGHFFNSPLLYEQFKKVKKELLGDDGHVKEMYMKPSLRILFRAYDASVVCRGPIFGLSESQIGYEAFLVNLCPPETYGKRRHRVNVLKDLYAEIDLSIQHEEDVLDLHDHYKELISNITKEKVYEHFDMIDGLAVKTDGRFTYSPIAIDMMSTHLDNLMDTVRSFNGTLPTLSSLSTMKASYCPVKVRACKAMESMRNLVQFYDVSSVKQLAFSTLERSNFVDLSMRMFDKDQIGGDREISILSSQFRILQSITEKLSRKLGSFTGVDMLANKDKETILTQHYIKTLQSDAGMMLTVDQTRWGPNFNTTLFGYMMTYLSNHSTEFYIPMLTCFMSEFKIFESLPYPELKDEATESYTLCGRLGKYHMAQGIFHYTSSLYHSMVVKVLSGVLTDCIKDDSMEVEINHMVTSDDLATFISCNSKDRETPLSDEIVQSIREKISKFLFNATKCFFRYFNIKSSDYKNMASEKLVEFNSIFLAPESVGSNSLKFTNSLISPKTTGDVILDYRSVMSSYTDGINSGLSDSEAYIVYYMNLCLLVLRWNLNIEKTPILHHKILKRGLKPKIDLLPDSVLQHRPVLKAETYKRMKEVASELSEMSNDPISKGIFKVMSDSLQNAQKLSGPLRAVYLQRKIAERYKARTPASDKIVENEALIEELSRTGSTTRFDAKVVDSKASIEGFFTHKMERVLPGHRKVVYRQSDKNLMSTISLLLSTYESLPSINNSADLEGVVRHLMRHFSSKLSVTLPSEISENNMSERYFILEQLVRTFQASRGNVARLEYNSTEKLIEKVYVSALSLISDISWTNKMPYISSYQTKKDRGTYTMRFHKGNSFRSSANQGSTLVATTSLTDVTLTRGDFQMAYRIMIENGDLEGYYATAEMTVPKSIIRKIKEEKNNRLTNSSADYDADFLAYFNMLSSFEIDDSQTLDDLDIKEAFESMESSIEFDLDELFDTMGNDNFERCNVVVIVPAPEYVAVSNANASYKLLVSALLIANYRNGCIHMTDETESDEDNIIKLVKSFLNCDSKETFMVAGNFSDTLSTVARSLKSFCLSRADFAKYDEIKSGNFDNIELVLFKSPLMGELKTKDSIQEIKSHVDAVLELEINPDQLNTVSVFTKIMNKMEGMDISFSEMDHISDGFF